MVEIGLTTDKKDLLEDLIKDSVVTDGDHHKQWYLEEIAKLLDIELPEHDSGICP